MTQVYLDQRRQLTSTPQRCQATIPISSVTSPGAQIVTIDSDSNEPIMPYGFGRQLPKAPPSMNDLNLPLNPFNILATMGVVNPTEYGRDENYSPQSQETSEPPPISMPPMNLSTTEGWKTPHTTTDDNRFHSDDEPRRIYFLTSSPSLPPPPRNLKTKSGLGMSFPKGGGGSQHFCGACGQLLSEPKDTLGLLSAKLNPRLKNFI